MENEVLKISHLTKHLGSRLILNDLTFDVHPGEIFGFIGPNGSGKTTTIKVMLGLLNLEAGEISICGHDIATERYEALSCVGGIIENPEMYRYLTGRENLEVFRRMYDGVPAERIDEVVALVGLTDRINDKIAKYSLGMRQRLGLAQALLNRPKLLILDEPTNGLDPVGIKDLRDILIKISHEEGSSVFISSHQLAELDQICDRFAVIDGGKLIAVRTMEEIRTGVSFDNRDHFRIITIEPAVPSALGVISKLNDTCEVSGATLNIVADTSAGGHGISDVVRELVMSGVPILAATPEKNSLEDAFINITAGTGAPAPKVFFTEGGDAK